LGCSCRYGYTGDTCAQSRFFFVCVLKFFNLDLYHSALDKQI
jgi:hypothetical protein